MPCRIRLALAGSAVAVVAAAALAGGSSGSVRVGGGGTAPLRLVPSSAQETATGPHPETPTCTPGPGVPPSSFRAYRRWCLPP